MKLNDLFVAPKLSNSTFKMVEEYCGSLNTTKEKFIDDTEEVEKVLSVVVKRRKTIPTKCMELQRQTTRFEILRLENAQVVVEENKNADDFKRIFQELKKIRLTNFSLEDLEAAERRVEKYHKRNKEIRDYLEKKRKKLKV